MENILTAREGTPPALTLDLTDIPADHLAIALANAALDPDGQVYPWRPGHPLLGATVVLDGQLWTVASKEPSADHAARMIRLDGQGHDGRAIAAAYQLRPVTWTAGDEIFLEMRGHGAPETTTAGAA